MPIDYETVAIPVTKGIDVNTRARLVAPQYLLEAINSRFTRGSGAEKRRGHAAHRVRSSKALPLNVTLPEITKSTPVENFFTGNRNFATGWVFGWGVSLAGAVRSNTRYETSAHPDAAYLFGSTSRDSESLAWNGHQLLSRVPGQVDGSPFGTVPSSAVMPTQRSSATAKNSGTQTYPDAADNGTIRVITWIGATSGYYTVLDSVTGATILAATSIEASNYVRAVAVGEWIHLVYKSSANTLLTLRSIHQSSPLTSSARSLGECPAGYFDTHKVNETTWVVARNTGLLTIDVTWLDAEGTSHPTKTNSTPALVTGLTLLTSVAIAVGPTSEGFALVWRGTAASVSRVWGRVYTAVGVAVHPAVDLGVVTLTARAVAVAPRYINDTTFDVYFDDHDGTNSVTKSATFSSAVVLSASRFHIRLASQAFRVGDRTFVWAGRQSTLQSTWLLLDEGLLPVGHLDYATANVPLHTAFPALAAMNWAGAAPTKDTCVFHCALGYRVRVPSETTVTGTNAPAVYTEPSIRYSILDFLPRLRSAQAGRTTFFAGSQVWAYDGQELVESGFHLGPENVTPAQSAGGSLTALGKYIYRVDLCYRNAQNEEVRSLSFYTAETTLTGGNNTITLTIPTVLTRRSNSYFLVFRNGNVGVQWFLCNSRDPSSALFKTNDQSVPSVSFVDSTLTDAALISREQHPGNGGFNYIDQVAPPACEVIASGRDRLWVAGGELPPGSVAPSRLFQPGETPSFHPLVGIQVDRSTEAITAIGFVGDVAVIFRRTHAYVQGGDGPDNVMNGAWDPSRLAFSDVGAVGQESLALISMGLLFQSPAGIRLVAAGGGLGAIGLPVDEVAKDLDIAATVVMGADQEVRFYSRAGDSLVYNYQFDCWSTWTVNAVGATRDHLTGLAALTTQDGSVWEETDGLWLDNGSTYRHRIRFGWLRAGSLMDWQRVRRIGAIGEWEGTPHSVHVEVFYDEREFYEEAFDWDMPQDAADASVNTDTFGSATFGSGTFGDGDP